MKRLGHIGRLGLARGRRRSGAASAPFWLDLLYVDQAWGWDANNARGFIPDMTPEEVAAASESAILASRKPASLEDIFAFTATGTSSRTYVDAAGVVRRDLAANAPRYDWSNGKAQLLLENAATNEIYYSQQFSNAAWQKQAGVTVTDNYALAPDGTMTAARLQAPSGFGIFQILTNYLDRTRSIYAKSNTGANQTLYEYNNDSDPRTVTTEWARLVWSGNDNNFDMYAFNGSDLDILIWGAQSELGLFASAYIPTTSSPVTRPIETARFSPLVEAILARSGAGVLVRGQKNLDNSGGARLVGYDGGNGFLMKEGGSNNIVFYSDGHYRATDTNAGTFGGSYGAAAGWDGAGRSVTSNGNILVSDTDLAGTVTTAYLARDAVADYAPGWYDYVGGLASRPANARLQGLAVRAPVLFDGGLVPDGDFGDPSGWTLGAGVVIQYGRMVASNATTLGYLDLNLETGATYSFSFQYNKTAGQQLRIANSNVNDSHGVTFLSLGLDNGAGTLSGTFTAAGRYLLIAADSAPFSGWIDKLRVVKLTNAPAPASVVEAAPTFAVSSRWNNFEIAAPGAPYSYTGDTGSGAGMRDGVDFGSYASVWACQDIGGWIAADLGSIQSVSRIDVRSIPASWVDPGGAYWGAEYLNGATVERSVDGVTWVTVGTLSGVVDGVTKSVTIDAMARYIRLNSADYINVGEFRVFVNSGGGDLLVFDGDSYSRGFDLPNPSTDSYPAQAVAMLSTAARPLVVYNAGKFRGQTTADQLANYSGDVAPLYGSTYNRRLLVIIPTTSDMLADPAGDTVAEMLAHTQAYVDAANATGFAVLVGTLPDWNMAAHPEYTVNDPATVAAWNAGVKALQGIAGYFDVAADSLIGSNGHASNLWANTAYFQADAIPHPNTAGYARIAALVVPKIEALRA